MPGDDSTDTVRLGKDALDKIDVAEEYITKVSNVATSEQKRQASEIAQTARERVSNVMKESKSAKNKSIRSDTKSKFDTSNIGDVDRGDVIKTELQKLIAFVDKYSAREDVVVITKKEEVENPVNPALLAANAMLNINLAAERNTVAVLQAALAAKTAEYDRVTAAIKLAEAHIMRLNEQHRQNMQRIASNVKDIKDLQAEARKRMHDLEEKDNDIKRIQRDISVLQNEIGALDIQGSLLNRIAVANSQNAGLVANEQRLKNQVRDMALQIQQLTGQIGDVFTPDTLVYNNTKLERQIADNNRTIETLQQQADVLKERIRNLTAEGDKRKLVIEGLREKLVAEQGKLVAEQGKLGQDNIRVRDVQ